MMIRVVVFGMLAACAMAQFPMMGLGGFGGLDLKNIKDMIPEGTFDMIKNMKPKDIKEAIQNMPPEMADMMKGMGITEEQINEAVKNIPEDLDVASMIDQAKDKMGDLIDSSKDSLKDKIEEQMSGMSEEVKKQLEEAGIDTSEGAEGFVTQILPKFTEMIGETLKEEGIDTEDKEKLREELRKHIREFAGANEDDSDEEIREKFMKGFLEEMKQNGFDIKTDDTTEGFQELKKQVTAQLKDMGFDLEEGFDMNNLPEMLQKINPQQMMSMFAPMMQGPRMMGPPMMNRPPMMHQPPMHPAMNIELQLNIHRRPTVPVVTPSYVRGAEDALMHAFGDDSDVIRHVMAVKYGAETGSVMEEDLHEILRDLMHYRLEARVLMTKNQMLRNRLYGPMF